MNLPVYLALAPCLPLATATSKPGPGSPSWEIYALEQSVIKAPGTPISVIHSGGLVNTVPELCPQLVFFMVCIALLIKQKDGESQDIAAEAQEQYETKRLSTQRP